MARPLRLEFTGALYHVTARGNERRRIFLGNGDDDRVTFLEVLGRTCERFHWICHAYCLMTNHYHLVVETPDANLSKGVRQLNGVYTRYVNRSHGRVGHLFQGRFKGILVERDSYLLELARYVVLNPVRARIVTRTAGVVLEQLSRDGRARSRPVVLGNRRALGHVCRDPRRGHCTIPTVCRRRNRSPQSLVRSEKSGLPGVRAIRRTDAGLDRPRTSSPRDSEAPTSAGREVTGALRGAICRTGPGNGGGVPDRRLQHADDRRALQGRTNDSQPGRETL